MQGHEDDQRAGVPLIWRKAEKSEDIQPKEEKVPEWPYWNFSILKGSLIKKIESDRERLFLGQIIIGQGGMILN